MKKQVVIRNFHLTDAVLKQKGDEFIALLDRDASDFADRGYDAAAKLNFETARNIVNAIPSDETFESAKMVKTAAKDAARNTLEKSMRTIFNMAANKLGSNSAEYRAFGNAAISDQPDAELARTYKVAVTGATTYKEELSTEGLTQEKIDNLLALGIAFDNAIDALAKGITDRDIATQDRVVALNALYALVIKYAGIGQDIYYETDEAKYNDYIIYDTPSGMPEDVPETPV